MIVKLMGLTDIVAAVLIAYSNVPVISYFKWVVVFILAVKGFSSLIS